MLSTARNARAARPQLTNLSIGVGLPEVADNVVQQIVIQHHILALVGFAVKPVAEFGNGGTLADRHGFEHGQDLLGVAAAEADVAIAMDVREVVGMHRVGGLMIPAKAGVALM